MLEALIERAERAGIFLDLDGSLSQIVAHPSLSVPEPGAREVLAASVARYRVVVVVTGRRAEEAAELIGVDGVRYEGLYGMQDAAPELTLALLPQIEAVSSRVESAWVEDKGVSVAIHYRATSDPVKARAQLAAELEPIAAASGFELVEGKMVLELVPRDRPMKGAAVERIAGQEGLEAVLFAGDDVADLDAFAALDRMKARGVATVKVAVAGVETPEELVSSADLTVDGPSGLVGFLRSLVLGQIG